MPPSWATAQALPCGTPGQGSGSRRRQIPGRHAFGSRAPPLFRDWPRSQSFQSLSQNPAFRDARTPASRRRLRSRRRRRRWPSWRCPTASASPVSGRTKAATAAAMNSADPSWLTTTIHQPRSARRAARPVAVHLGQSQVAGDEKEHATDDFRGPDVPMQLRGSEVPEQRHRQAGAEVQRADKEGDRTRPIQPTGLSRPPTPVSRPHHPIGSASRGALATCRHRRVATSSEEDPTKHEHSSSQPRPPNMRLSQKRPDREERPTNHERGSRNSIDPSQPPSSRRIGPTPRLSKIPTPADEHPPLAQRPPVESHRGSVVGCSPTGFSGGWRRSGGLPRQGEPPIGDRTRRPVTPR